MYHYCEKWSSYHENHICGEWIDTPQHQVFYLTFESPLPITAGAAQAEPPATFPKLLVHWWCQDEPEDGNIHPHFSMALTAPSSPSAWIVMVRLHLMEKREPVPAEGEMKVPAVPFSHS